MKRIFLTELSKLPSKGNIILLAILVLIYIGFSVGFISTLSMSENSQFGTVSQSLLQSVFGLAALLISIFMITNIGNEYKHGTLKKNIIDGFSRDDFFTGKMMILSLCVIFSFLLGVLCLFIVAVATGEIQAFTEQVDFQLLSSFFIKLAYGGLWATFLVFISGKITMSLVIYFVWGIVESVLVALQGGLREKLNIPDSFDIQEYLPRSSVDLVLQRGDLIEPKSIVITSIYIILFLVLPYYLFTKVDIKS